MATLTPLPQTNSDVIQSNDNIFTLLWRNYFVALDTVVRGLAPAVTAAGAAGAASGLTTLSNSLAANVALNSVSAFFTGPQIAQGTAGTWFVTGTVSLQDNSAAAGFLVRLWDGTTVIASAATVSPTAGYRMSATVSGVITNPKGNLRIDVSDNASTTGLILANFSGLGKDSTITAIRIG